VKDARLLFINAHVQIRLHCILGNG